MASVVIQIRLNSYCTVEDFLRIKEEAFSGVSNSKLRIDPTKTIPSDLIILRLCDEAGCVKVADRPSADGRVLCAGHR